jgi:hypothetical protein
VRVIPGGSSPSVAPGEGFPECFGAFPECIWHSEKQLSPVVTLPAERRSAEAVGV